MVVVINLVDLGFLSIEEIPLPGLTLIPESLKFLPLVSRKRGSLAIK
jgi:hypothetical protein